MNKQTKMKMINEAVQRSNVAIAKQAKAEILTDGRIEYTMLAANGKYIEKVSYREILRTLNGQDMRGIHNAN